MLKQHDACLLGCSVDDDNVIGEDLDSALRSLQNLTAKVSVSC